jgi:uncharacterized damage-inducible protein DinB
MKRAHRWTLGLTLVALSAAGSVLASSHTEKPAAAAAAKPAAAAPADALRADILGQIADAREKLVALAEATPAEKYTWRPGEGVRSVGEVYLHVAGGNYFLPTLWGTKPPEGIDMRNMEKDGADKAKVIAALKKSFDSVEGVIKAASPADLDKKIKIFGNDGTERQAILIVATHAHEHLGQAIAYSRMNGIVPPWSAGGGQ